VAEHYRVFRRAGLFLCVETSGAAMSPDWITYCCVAAASLAGVALTVLAFRRRAVPPAATKEQVFHPVPFRKASEDWDPVEPDPRGRRTVFRRPGNHVLAHLDGPRDVPPQGWVINRSSRGIGLIVDRPVVPGRVFLVRPSQAPVGTPRVEASVRWCIKRPDHHEIGCQFTDPLPPSLLLQFG
jgi:hypothetical protein